MCGVDVVDGRKECRSKRKRKIDGVDEEGKDVRRCGDDYDVLSTCMAALTTLLRSPNQTTSHSGDDDDDDGDGNADVDDGGGGHGDSGQRKMRDRGNNEDTVDDGNDDDDKGPESTQDAKLVMMMMSDHFFATALRVVEEMPLEGEKVGGRGAEGV